jgi:glycosyltransferase involved in cell wall biosynthesis
VSKLLKNYPSLEFHVFGGSSLKEAILGCFDTSLRDQIHVHARLSVTEMVDVISQTKVLLLPSLYEGFGMATTEAMACGCVVVATPTGFAAEIHDGIDGCICNFHYVIAIINKCQILLDNNFLRMQIALAARQRIDNLDWQNQVKKLEKLYISSLRSFVRKYSVNGIHFNTIFIFFTHLRVGITALLLFALNYCTTFLIDTP